MTDLVAPDLTDYTVHTSDAARRRLARRYAAERRFRALGLAAVLTAMAALALLLATVLVQAVPAFTLYYASLPIELSGDRIDRDNLAKSEFDGLVDDAID